MERIRNILRDGVLALVLGCGAGVAAGAALFVIGALTGGGVSAGLTAARSGLMLAGGFALLFSAGLFLRGERLPEDAFRLRPQETPGQPHGPDVSTKLFRTMHRKYAALLIGIGILLAAGAADGLIWLRG